MWRFPCHLVAGWHVFRTPNNVAVTFILWGMSKTNAISQYSYHKVIFAIKKKKKRPTTFFNFSLWSDFTLLLGYKKGTESSPIPSLRPPVTASYITMYNGQIIVNPAVIPLTKSLTSFGFYHILNRGTYINFYYMYSVTWQPHN